MTDYYRNGAWAVTDTRVQTPRADYDLNSITAVEVSRAPLWGAISLASAGVAAAWSLRHILYPGEIMAIAATSAILTAAASQIAWLRFSGSSWRGTETGLVWAMLWRAKQVRAAIRQAQQDARLMREPDTATPQMSGGISIDETEDSHGSRVHRAGKSMTSHS